MIRALLSKRMSQIVLATVLATLGALASAALLAYLNRLASDTVPVANAAIVLTTLGWVAVMFLGNLTSQLYLARYGASTVAELRRSLCERFLTMDYQKMHAMGKHLVSGSLITDLAQLATLCVVLPMFFFNAMTLVFCLGYLGFLSAKLLGVLVLFLLMAFGLSSLMMHRFGIRFRALRAEEDTLNECFHAISDGKKELSLNGARRRHFLDEVIQPSIDRAQRLAFSAQRWWSYSGAGAGALNFCALFGVIYFGHFSFHLDQVTLLQAFAVSLFVMNPADFLINAWRDLSIGFAAAKRLEKLDITAVESVTADRAHPPITWHTLSLSDLQYRYPDVDRHGFCFGPLNLTISRGEILFVVGGNGSGKSTLALLLIGLLRPLSGHIHLDGKTVTEDNLPAYRQLFSSVFFDFYLFRHVIDREGRLAPDAHINGLLKTLDLADKVQAVNGVLSTLTLSQGQRKRLALAQSYCDDGDIFLFDEWAADQDPEFKHYFYLELLPELKRRGKTVIAITHDEKYFHCADRRITLEQGGLVAPGTLADAPELLSA